MIESLMYLGIGFLIATLLALAVIPLIHARAVRLTVRRLENAMPKSLAEIRADKDLLRADFAISTRRLEMDNAQLRETNASQRAEIGRKNDVINRYRIERDAQNVEVLLLKAEVGALREQYATAGARPEPARRPDYDIEAVSVAPVDLAEPKVAQPTSASVHGALDESLDQRMPVPFVMADPRASLARELMVAAARRDSEEGSDGAVTVTVPAARYEMKKTAKFFTGDASFDQQRESAREPGGLPGARKDASIHLSPNDQLMQEPLRSIIPFKAISFFVLVVGCGIAVFMWAPFGDEPAKLVAGLVQGVGPSGTTPPANVAARGPADEAKPAADVSQQIEHLTREVSDMRSSVQQFTAQQEQQLTAKQEQAPPQAEKEAKEARLSAPPPTQQRLAPVPETPPTTIPGWIVRDVIGSTAIVQGPNGIWHVVRGDNLPGLGRVDSIVRWGNRWIVATNRGLISTP